MSRAREHYVCIIIIDKTLLLKFWHVNDTKTKREFKSVATYVDFCVCCFMRSNRIFIFCCVYIAPECLIYYIILFDKRRDRGEKQTRKIRRVLCEKLKRSVIKTWLSFVLYANWFARSPDFYLSLVEVSPSPSPRHIRGKFPKGNCLPNFADLEPLKLLSFAFRDNATFSFSAFFLLARIRAQGWRGLRIETEFAAPGCKELA